MARAKKKTRQPKDDDHLYLSRQEAAQYLGISLLVLGYYVHEGLMECDFFPGPREKSYRFTKEHLDDFNKLRAGFA